MSDQREQFEAWWTVYEKEQHFGCGEVANGFAFDAWRAGAKIKDAEIAAVEVRLLEEIANLAYTWPDDQYAELKIRDLIEERKIK